MTELSLGRRLVLTAVAVVAAAMLFRGTVASALVTRGDDALRAGDEAVAFRYYRRALRVEPHEATAANRLAFHLALRRSGADARAAIAVADDVLCQNGSDGELLVDRALAEQQLHRWRVAERDFSHAAVLLHDARYEHFAGRAALHFSDRLAAQRHFRNALRLDPAFAPARAALGSR